MGVAVVAAAVDAAAAVAGASVGAANDVQPMVVNDCLNEVRQRQQQLVAVVD